MSSIRIASYLAAVFLTACATTPSQKPRIQQEQYWSFASTWNVVSKCGASGQMDAGIASLGMGYLRNVLAASTYDVETLQGVMARYSADTPTTAQCNEAAMTIHTRRRTIDQNNAAVAADQKAWDDFANANRPRKPIYCNTIGTQTVCN